MCHTYFGVKPAKQDQTWALHIACGNCKSTLLRWAKCEKYFGFGFPNCKSTLLRWAKSEKYFGFGFPMD